MVPRPLRESQRRSARQRRSGLPHEGQRDGLVAVDLTSALAALALGARTIDERQHRALCSCFVSRAQNAAFHLRAVCPEGAGRSAVARSATGSKCDGFLNTRARQVQKLVMWPVNSTPYQASCSASVSGGHGNSSTRITRSGMRSAAKKLL